MIPRVEVSATAVSPYEFGLFAAGLVLSGEGDHWQYGGVEYASEGCPSTSEWVQECYGLPTGTLTVTRTGDRVLQVVATTIPITVWAEGAGGDVTPAGPQTIAPGGAVTFTAAVEATGVELFAAGEGCAQPDTPAWSSEVPFPAGVRVLLPVTGCPGQQQEEKTGSGPLWLASGAPFTVYAGASCKAVGFSDAEGLARRRLALGEQHAVERHVWQHDLAVPRAVDVTGGGAAVPLAVGLGRLEAALADSYGGVGVVHAPRALAPLMAEARQISQVRSQLRTVLGTPVAFGGGYLATGPSGAAAAAGTAWLYASGVVTIRRSEVFVPVMPTTGGFDTRTNDVLVIAERTFVVTSDCALFAVQVDVGGTE